MLESYKKRHLLAEVEKVVKIVVSLLDHHNQVVDAVLAELDTVFEVDDVSLFLALAERVEKAV